MKNEKLVEQGMLLREKRIAAGLTQERLAIISGVSLTHIQKVENGYKGMGKEVMDRVEKVLEVEE